MSSYVWRGRVKVTVRCVAWFCWCAYMLCLVGSSFRIGSECFYVWRGSERGGGAGACWLRVGCVLAACGMWAQDGEQSRRGVSNHQWCSSPADVTSQFSETFTLNID